MLGHRRDLLVVSCQTRRDSLRWSTKWWTLCAIYTNSWEVPATYRSACAHWTVQMKNLGDEFPPCPNCRRAISHTKI
jgi:hypothetical protein